MRLPRGLSGDDLAKRLIQLGYERTRQTGSHLRLTRSSNEGEYHITIPRHKTLRVGTLNSILIDVAAHMNLSKGSFAQEIILGQEDNAFRHHINRIRQPPAC